MDNILSSRYLRSPEAGSVISLVAVIVFFVVLGRVNLGTLLGAASWINFAANLGMVALPVGLLMIAGEIDISIGAMIPAGSMTMAIVSGYFGFPTIVGICCALGFGVVIGLLNGFLTDVVVTKLAPPTANIQRFDDDASAVQALLSGQVPLIGCSNTVSAQVEKVDPGQFDVKFGLQRQVQGVAVKPGSTELLKAVNDFVAQAKKDGELDAIHQKWLGTPAPDVLGEPARL